MIISVVQCCLLGVCELIRSSVCEKKNTTPKTLVATYKTWGPRASRLPGFVHSLTRTEHFIFMVPCIVTLMLIRVTRYNRCLFTPELLYMFRVSNAPVIRKTSKCNCSFWYRSQYLSNKLPPVWPNQAISFDLVGSY